jgi:hypothetical protein
VASGSVVLDFEAPEGTVGEVRVPVLDCAGRVIVSGQEGLSGDYVVDVVEGEGRAVEVRDVKGGRWTATFMCL